MRNGKAIPGQTGAWRRGVFTFLFPSSSDRWFKLADQELINFFFYRKVVLRQPLLPRHVGFVHEIDFLGDHQPWEIWDACGGPHPYGKEIYFFCKLKKLSKCTHRSTECKELPQEKTLYTRKKSKEDQRLKRKRSRENQRTIDANKKVKLSTQLEMGQQPELGQTLELKQPERQSCSRNLTTDEKLNINDGVATIGYDQCHSFCVPTTCEINASYYNYDHYGATNSNWKEYSIYTQSAGAAGGRQRDNVDEYLMRSLHAENQMQP
ncbi:hypothetical protein D8674_022888 [Pyrus ussuriensis x Pyrus communis]|uniref:NAC domain-containing protein n=1 Tax=Pyrus ussuriensis x Pyrus communis TaxID=2448454 RepID=A0A5N5GSX2_9ROSA|nr:hypothetical protein D8674_022888 [Pyrus ussuriensis x Pyrus communis]